MAKKKGKTRFRAAMLMTQGRSRAFTRRGNGFKKEIKAGDIVELENSLISDVNKELSRRAKKAYNGNDVVKIVVKTTSTIVVTSKYDGIVLADVVIDEEDVNDEAV